MERPGICFVKVTQRLKAGTGVCLPGRRVVPGGTAVWGAEYVRVWGRGRSVCPWASHVDISVALHICLCEQELGAHGCLCASLCLCVFLSLGDFMRLCRTDTVTVPDPCVGMRCVPVCIWCRWESSLQEHVWALGVYFGERVSHSHREFLTVEERSVDEDV